MLVCVAGCGGLRMRREPENVRRSEEEKLSFETSEYISWMLELSVDLYLI